MIKIINAMFSFLKYILLIVSFVMTFYVISAMYQRLGKSFMDAMDIFIPYIVLFILFGINYIFKQKQVTQCIFYNITCCLVFIVLIFTAYRAISDSYMILQLQSSYKMSFDYFSDMIAPLKAMFYLLIAGNICFMLSKRKEKEKISTQKVPEEITHSE